MGNGQSSPAGSHPLPPAAKVQTSHREHHRRSPSPGGQARTLPPARKKSLELPDLARLNFTSATSPSTTAAVAAGADRSPAKQAAAAANEATTNGTPGKAGSRGMLGRKRPSPLAPAIMTSPLSPISPKQTPAHAQSSSHNPYFPPTATAAAGGFGSSQVSAEASPIDIPHTPSQAPPPALPAYDRVAYTPEPPSRRTSEAQPAPQPTTTTLLPATRKTTAGPAAGPGKKARIADEPPSFLPAAPTTAPAAVAAPTAAPSTSPTLSPAAKTHKPKQPSVTGADEDNTIRSSLPSGGDEYPPGQDPASQPQPPPQPQQPQPQQHQQPPSSSAVAGAAAAGGGALGLSLSQDQPPPQKAPAPARPREELVSVEAEEGVPTIINWTGGGKEVYVCGTFAKNWKERLKMSKSTHDFTLVLNLPPGPHRLKFIVDETWRCSDDLANATDADGSLVNYIEVEPTRKDGDGPGWSSEWDTHLGVDSDDDSQWTTDIPDALVRAQALEEQHLNKVANLAPANRQPGSAALQNPQGLPHPPGLPRHLEKVILNNPTNKDGAQAGTDKNAGGGACWTATPDDNSILPIPNHVVLNHLTASAIRNGVLAVGTTTRYKRKYISTLLYKPVEL